MIIVGAGISGLSAAFYAQLNGYHTRIFEMHNVPGGLCAAWKKKGYTFDISMHMVTGSLSGPFHQIWEELGVSKNFDFHYHDVISLVEGLGHRMLFSTDKEEVENSMLAISPEDAKLIRQFIRLIFGPDLTRAASLKPSELSGIGDKIKLIPAIFPLIPVFLKYKKMTLQDFAAKFKSPFLREAVRFLLDAPGWPMPGFPMVALSGFVEGSVTAAGTPLGGSFKVMRHIAGQVKKMGGEISYKSRVKELILEGDRAAGIRLEDGSEYKADHIVWAGDGHSLIFDILKEKYIDGRIRKMYDEWTPVKPVVHVMMGVNRDFSGEPHRMVIKPGRSFRIAEKDFEWMTVMHHCYDPSRAGEGKSVVEVWFDTDYEYWERLASNREKYEAEKKAIAERVVDELDKHWPGFAEQLEVIDVPTPATYVRYTGNWKGSPDGWYINPSNMTSASPLRSLPGLEGLSMVGQWTVPFSGTIMAAGSGRQLIELMVHREGREFRTAL